MKTVTILKKILERNSKRRVNKLTPMDVKDIKTSIKNLVPRWPQIIYFY